MARTSVTRWLIGFLFAMALGLAAISPAVALAEDAGEVRLDDEETCPRKISVW